MINFKPQIGPYAHSNNSTTSIMYHVVLALMPAVCVAGLRFGPSAIRVVIACVVAAVFAEVVCLSLQRKPLRNALDGSAILTGLILALSLPAHFQTELCVLGALFCIVVGKQAYGGLGQNIFNPAMLGRVFLLICFPVQMNDWSAPYAGEVQSAAEWLSYDGVSAATVLSRSISTPTINELLTGKMSGSIGEVHSIWLLLGGIYLLYRRIVTPAIPLCFFIGLLFPALVANLFQPEQFLAPHIHMFSGAAVLCAFFIATDMVTSPSSTKGQMIYGLLCGGLVWLIREAGSYPEGVAFAVLIVNAVSPLIDHYIQPKRFGSSKQLVEEK
ncbi:RnfABCDGE type electron transport complex subunit D [Vibrio agarivorans]|uniref:RnfABCDGE type electron transport complex subunit D n=1 Tax=Vibrio agarivorans TaxID=153622 RepID=UPI002232BEE6|nr:RnfABCDGE type electron transport complex subunit D [Vibrio agarivorans]